jgi:putative membrane protein
MFTGNVDGAVGSATSVMVMGDRYKLMLMLAVLGVFVWSAINPHDYFTWFLEVLPVMVGFFVLQATYKTFPLTGLAYGLIALHAVILMVGGHYTYAHVPLFDTLKDSFGWTRNHYDKVGHFAQGFVPAIIAREILLRTTPLSQGKMLFFLVLCVCLAISASYELIEWLVAIVAGVGAEEFLGTQGDVWDTQKDMAFAFVGAIFAQMSLASWHDRCLLNLTLSRL